MYVQAESDSDDEVPLASRKRKSGAQKIKKEKKYESSDEENVPKKVRFTANLISDLETWILIWFHGASLSLQISEIFICLFIAEESKEGTYQQQQKSSC